MGYLHFTNMDKNMLDNFNGHSHYQILIKYIYVVLEMQHVDRYDLPIKHLFYALHTLWIHEKSAGYQFIIQQTWTVWNYSKSLSINWLLESLLIQLISKSVSPPWDSKRNITTVPQEFQLSTIFISLSSILSYRLD